jgi:hypothetical protein
MAKEHGQDRAGGRKPNEADGKAKRQYKTPRLTTYGNLRQLALQKGGSKSDGGAGEPKSRM